MDRIADVLDAAEETPVSVPTVVDHSESDDFEDRVREFRRNAAANATLDFQDARVNMRQIIQTGMEMLPDVVQSVSETQSDKAINAATGFLKVLGELNKSLVDLNNDAIGKPTKQAASAPAIENQTNNVIVVEDSADIFRLAAQKSQKKRDFE